jgi:hypothetical protein
MGAVLSISQGKQLNNLVASYPDAGFRRRQRRHTELVAIRVSHDYPAHV